MATTMEKKGETIKTIAWTCFVLCLFASVQGGKPHVEIELSAPVVREGGNLTIRCLTVNAAHVCQLIPPNGNGVSLSATLKNGTKDGVNYDGSGLDRGECIIRIPIVEEKHNGIWQCTMTVGLEDAQASREIIVAKAPGPPQLELSRTQINPADVHTYRKGETMEISCTVKHGRPASNISIYLGDELISDDNNNNRYDGNKAEDAELKITRSIQVTDNGKDVRCVANHVALKTPLESYKKKIQVWYEPQPIEEHPIQRYGFRIGHVETIKIEVDSNPQPDFVWSVNGEEIRAGPYQNQRMKVLPAEPMANGKWLAQLEIDSVQKSDTENEYMLLAKNKEGTAAPYRIKISTSTEPESSGFGAVHIVGIVVAVLALSLLIFVAVFARATGRWCFADGPSVRNIGESSDTESAGRYSRSEVDSSGLSKRPRILLSQLFRRNKDKVSGTDTDTMRTVVTVDDEKIPETTDVIEKSNPEGGLVYAELDLTQKEQVPAPRRVSDDKTEYAEILYAKPEGKNITTDKK